MGAGIGALLVKNERRGTSRWSSGLGFHGNERYDCKGVNCLEINEDFLDTFWDFQINILGERMILQFICAGAQV